VIKLKCYVPECTYRNYDTFSAASEEDNMIYWLFIGYKKKIEHSFDRRNFGEMERIVNLLCNMTEQTTHFQLRHDFTKVEQISCESAIDMSSTGFRMSVNEFLP
jgi:hypothetical protein